MSDANTPEPAEPPVRSPKPPLPLYVWVLIAVVLAIPVGFGLGADAQRYDSAPVWIQRALEAFAVALELAPRLILRALGALAAPLIVLAILNAIVANVIRGRQGLVMMAYYLFNTTVAMVLGLTIAGLVRPGSGATLERPESEAPRIIDRLLDRAEPKALGPRASVAEIIDQMVPSSVGEAFVSNNLAQLVLITLAIGIGLAHLRDRRGEPIRSQIKLVADLLNVGFELLMKVLLWIVALVPFAVFGVVAIGLAREGVALFFQLGWFIGAVLIGLVLQLVLYVAEVAGIGRIGPLRFLGGSTNVMAMTFSSSSTAATIPITLRSLTERLGISRTSSQLAACVGTNFNNDGTALYQSMVVMFLAQAMGMSIGGTDFFLIMLTTLLASAGAGGIPSGSFVTLPLILASVQVPDFQLPLLLTIDWFVDRCRTTVNVLGDMTVAILLERTEPPEPAALVASENDDA